MRPKVSSFAVSRTKATTSPSVSSALKEFTSAWPVEDGGKGSIVNTLASVIF